MALALNSSIWRNMPGLLLLVVLAGCSIASDLQQPWAGQPDEASPQAMPLTMSAATSTTTRVEKQDVAPMRASASATENVKENVTPAAQGGLFSLAALKRKVDAAFTPEKPPPSQRQQLGDVLARKVLDNSSAVQDAVLQARLKGIVQRLSGPARRESAFPARWQVHVIDSSRADAFTSGGGHLFITRGMVDLLQTDERIATVLAHEMAHNLLAHVWSAREKKELARKAHRFSSEVLAKQMRMPWLGKSVSFLVRTSLNTYSRQQEYDADALGLHLLVKAGWRPQAALETFDFLRRHFREQSGLKNFFYSHHPLYERRRWYLANRIRAYYRKEAGLPPVRHGNWKQVRLSN